MPASDNMSSHGLPDGQRCCYPSKYCENPRVIKRNGQLHRFCEFHRRKANLNQRRLEKRRQLEHQLQYEMSDAERSHIEAQLEQLKQYQRHHHTPQVEEYDLDEEDLQLVEEFLKQHDLGLLEFDEEDDRFVAENLALP
jgi:hypothetical protein